MRSNLEKLLLYSIITNLIHKTTDYFILIYFALKQFIVIITLFLLLTLINTLVYPIQYLANQTPFAVRLQISDMLQRWQQSIGPREPKIVEAYEMLKNQKLLIEPPPHAATVKP